MELERDYMKRYGLKNKNEIWRAQRFLDLLRRRARSVLTRGGEGGDELISRLVNLGLLSEGSTLDDVLAIDLDRVFDRRLQTVVYKAGLSKTIGQARQFISHGHIAIDGDRVSSPGYMVKGEEERHLGFVYRSPLGDEEHVARVVKAEEGEAG